MDELMIKIDNVTKEYRLGAIGGTTLRDELQRWRAKRKHLADPTLKIGQTRGDSNERFMALNGVSFEVKKGEAVGIIGHNGAGKSTLLKLITRITAPTTGDIYLNGRIASMLEVGTGFHPELTGRENVYLNGAILGMTKKEIDAKMEDIIEFSEVRQFIDTPVKRYSSGMYVKLAFSVAAHLDSEIMIMDEVLAVGDVAFQNKCLKKMRSAAKEDGRTVLYVSHNMNTIRQLCDRCIVMEHGRVLFDGDVDRAIDLYMGNKMTESVFQSYESYERPKWLKNPSIKILEAEFVDKEEPCFEATEQICLRLKWQTLRNIENAGVRIEICNSEGIAQAAYMVCNFYTGSEGTIAEAVLRLDTSMLMDADYRGFYVFFDKNEFGSNIDLDCVPGLNFQKSTTDATEKWIWDSKHWGYIQLPVPQILSLR